MITLDNYEEFFLLYVDNELSMTDRQAVERFVAQHSGLQEEWEALLQCRLTPERHLQFPGRAALHRSEADDTDYTEQFLAYIDNELGIKDRKAVEELLARQP